MSVGPEFRGIAPPSPRHRAADRTVELAAAVSEPEALPRWKTDRFDADDWEPVAGADLGDHLNRHVEVYEGIEYRLIGVGDDGASADERPIMVQAIHDATDPHGKPVRAGSTRVLNVLLDEQFPVRTGSPR